MTEHRSTSSRGRFPLVAAGVGALGVVAILSILVLAPPPGEITGALIIALVVLLMLIGVPVAICMMVAATVGIWALSGWTAVAGTLSHTVFGTTATWQLSVIPLFVLMGSAMSRGGIAGGAFDAAKQWVGGVPGGLAVSTTFAGAGLAAASGSSIGIAHALGRVAVPEMIRARYSPGFATASVLMAGTLGQLIPPSIMLVIYAGVAQTPVGPQLMAALLPGLVLALGYGLLIVIRSAMNPELAPRVPRAGVTWSSRLRSVKGVVPTALVVVTVVGGMFTGVFTATEAAAVGALVALVIGLGAVLRHAEGRSAAARFVRDTVADAVVKTATIFLVLIGVHLLTRALALSGIATSISQWLVDLDLSRVTFLLVLVAILLLLGMFLEPTSVILLTFPVVAPALEVFGVDLIWYGVFSILLAEIGLVTPPIGVLTFIVHRLVMDREISLGHEVKLQDVFRNAMPFLGVALLVVLALIAAPELVEWLPNLSQAE